MNTKEQTMNEVEYAGWIVKDTAKHIIEALAIYAVALGGYWALVG
jgi:hypothetical protein